VADLVATREGVAVARRGGRDLEAVQPEAAVAREGRAAISVALGLGCVVAFVAYGRWRLAPQRDKPVETLLPAS